MGSRLRFVRITGVLAALLLVVAATPAAASTLTFGPAADATVAQDLPTTNFGSDPKLEADQSPVRDFLLKFTVTGVGANPVSAVTLRLYNVNGSTAGGNFYRATDTSWQESTVTWSNAPAASETPVATLGAVASGQWYEVDVTSAVTGDGTYGFRVVTTSTNGADYTSKEGTAGFAPQLVVTFGGGTGDTSPPTVSIGSPAGGQTVSGVVSVQATASDDVAVTKVEFLVDGTLRATDTSSPYAFSWDTTAASNGGHSLDATAYDAAGNTGRSATVSVSVDNPSSTGTTVVFGAAGDLGATSNTTATLGALDGSGANFFLALGDLSYGDKSPEQAWCDYVKSKLPTLGSTFPFELAVGNHEDQNGTNGDILNFAACLPDRLNSTSGPSSRYGVEYYIDYPASSPLVRTIMTATDLTVQGVTYSYSKGDPHYNWVASAIDNARSAGIPWVVVGMHEPGLSAGSHGGSSLDLANLLVQKKVDLVLGAHDHNYQRSKQLAIGTGCSAVPYGSFDADCVVDDGSDAQYGKGAGTVFVIDGTGGKSLSSVSTSSAEAPYFAKLDATTFGFTRYTVTADRIDARFVNSAGSFTDAFSIIGGGAPPPPPPADTTPPAAPTNLTATTTVGRVDLSWTASTDNVGVAGYRVFRDGVQIGTASVTFYSDTTVSQNTTYTYMVKAYDAAGNVSGSSNSVTVTTPIVLTFTPVADTYVAADVPTANFGTATTFQVDGSPIRQTLMKFSISGVGTRKVIGATLRLHNVDSSSRGGDFYRVADTSWGETTVTWGSAPAADPSPFASLGKVSAGSFYNVGVSAIVTGDGAISLKITSTSRNGAWYDSREGPQSFRPQLIVTVE